MHGSHDVLHQRDDLLVQLDRPHGVGVARRPHANDGEEDKQALLVRVPATRDPFDIVNETIDERELGRFNEVHQWLVDSTDGVAPAKAIEHDGDVTDKYVADTRLGRDQPRVLGDDVLDLPIKWTISIDGIVCLIDDIGPDINLIAVEDKPTVLAP